MRTKPPFDSEPDSKLKTTATILWEFALLHGMSMDLCGSGCAKQAVENIRNLYAAKEAPTLVLFK